MSPLTSALSALHGSLSMRSTMRRRKWAGFGILFWALRKMMPRMPGSLPRFFESVAVMPFERQAGHFDEAGPVVIFGDSGLLVVRRAGPLVVHFEEEKISELLDV